MKKTIILLFTLALMLGICACGRKTADVPAQPTGTDETQKEKKPEEKSVTYQVAKELYTDSLSDADGTVLATCSFEIPRLHAVLSDGTEVSENLVAQNPSEPMRRAWSVVTSFNADMDANLSAKKTFFKTIGEWAQADYRSSMTGLAPWSGAYVDESTFNVYQTDTLVSVCTQFYDFTGGAHPNGGCDTYNFDLFTGEMVSYADLVTDEDAFRKIVSDEILRQIQESGLADGLYEDYEAYVRDLLYADECYSAQGVSYIFEEGNIGPHAAGSPTFAIPYGKIANLLNERGKAILPIQPEDIVLADFYETAELWSYFYLYTMPTDVEAPAVERDGYLYERVKFKGVATLDELKHLLLEHVSDTLAGNWLSGNQYCDINGALYCAGACRGSDITLGESAYRVELAQDGGKVIGTTERLDTEQVNPETGKFSVIDKMTTEYPFILTADGHAVFTDFPYPY